MIEREDRMEPKYPHIHVTLVGKDGNAWSIMGRVRQALREAGVGHEEVNQYVEESMSKDYDHVLQTAMKWVSCD